MRRSIILLLSLALHIAICPKLDAVEISLNVFSGSETAVTFDDPAFPSALTTSPFTVNGVTYSDLGGGSGLLVDSSFGSWFDDVPGGSQGNTLRNEQTVSNLRMDFSSPVKRVGLVFASGLVGTTYTLTAFDNALSPLGSTTVTTASTGPGAPWAFAGLQFTQNILRIELLELSVNTNISSFDDLRFEAIPEPSTLALAAFGFAGLLAYGWRRRHTV